MVQTHHPYRAERLARAALSVSSVLLALSGCLPDDTLQPTRQSSRGSANAPAERTSDNDTEGAASGADARPSTGNNAAAPGAGGAGQAELDPMPERSEQGLPVGSTGSGERLIRPAAQSPAQGDGTGAFRTTCLFSHMRHDDPLGSPGRAGKARLHTFFGNTLANSESTAESLLSSGNSTCRGGIADRSAYWIPTLLDDAGKPVVPQTAEIYYRSGYEGISARSIEEFPPGLRMMAGDPSADDEQSDAHWECNRKAGERHASIPTCATGDSLMMHVEFPQCWNGRDLDSDDHRSHMALVKDGKCPSSHPVAIPAITMSVSYLVPTGGVDGFRLDSDDYAKSKPGGFSANAKWFDAWDPDLVATWVPKCVNTALDCYSHLLGDGRETYFLPKDVASGDR